MRGNQQTQSENEQSLINNTVGSKDAIKVTADNQNNHIQQELKPVGKESNSDEIILSEKTSENVQSNVNTKDAPEAKSKINEQIAKLMESDPTKLAKEMNENKHTTNTATESSVSQSSVSQSSVSQSSVSQSSVSQNLTSQTMNKNTRAANITDPANSVVANSVENNSVSTDRKYRG